MPSFPSSYIGLKLPVELNITLLIPKESGFTEDHNILLFVCFIGYIFLSSSVSETQDLSLLVNDDLFRFILFLLENTLSTIDKVSLFSGLGINNNLEKSKVTIAQPLLVEAEEQLPMMT